jgi:tyrosinase
MTDSSGTSAPNVNVVLTCVSATSGGAVQFSANQTGPFSNSLSLAVPTAGSSVSFFVAGQFGQPSTNLGDVTIQAKAGSTMIGSVDLMVRIRKNANTLTNGERDRFIAAFATLNNRGLGRFADFRDMHTAISSPQAHDLPGFLPWHRAYILDLERELQAIDPSVALPYWRFDQPAPNLFIPDFMGSSDPNGRVQFSSSNPLTFWRSDNVTGVNREPRFDPTTTSAFVAAEADTLNLSPDYAGFRDDMESDPHDNAHTSFFGSISSIPTAARDPLFFLLHCNVDRLWAKWQRQNNRFDPAVQTSFDSNQINPLGHNLKDTMWPWNGDINPPRPPTAPGGTLTGSPCVNSPGPSPMVQDLLDYLGAINSNDCMGYSYDDTN